MKKTVLIALAVASLTAAGCKEKPKTPEATPAPQAGMPAQMPQGQMPNDAVHSGANPHAGMKPQEIPAGAGHKGKVISTMDAAGYTYLEVEENGQKLWVAVMQTKVNKGDVVEFPDSPPMQNFHSKTLNRTFDKIIFAPGIRIAGK
ncbi:lipoprotein [Geotalea uraniireducens]|uniref:Lipoprotein n=1 Tax=Geotalea uraniireducens TaxID=351604 RepID=A0ABN6VTU7_9BACT|nr:hypothetical protein [Geotalea uraniireducens]BDV42251.1 lipoprotein [Geotalea uraniireducens]